ncbi:MAG: DUF4397 domain-containing protein [Lacibacter sp.]
MLNKTFFSLLAVTVAFGFASCEKEAPQPANLLVVNAAISSPVAPNPLPTAGPAFDLRWNGTLLRNNVVYGAATVSAGTPVTTITNPVLISGAYSPVQAGTFGFNLALAGTSPGVNIYNRNITLQEGKSYTAVTYDFTPLYKHVLMEDNLTPPAAGKAKVRVVHTVPREIFASLGVPRLDTVDVVANTTQLYGARTFADVARNSSLHNFIEVDSGSYRFTLRVAGTPGTSPQTGLLALLPTPPAAPLRLEAGKIYTIVARLQFLAAPNPPAPALTIVAHN